MISTRDLLIVFISLLLLAKTLFSFFIWIVGHPPRADQSVVIGINLSGNGREKRESNT
jgi:hypothetical protein